MPGKLLAAGFAALITLLLTAGSAFAAPAVDGEFDIPGGVGTNNEITAGPDGNMWVTRQNDNGVARITTDGTVTPIATANTAYGITAGPDDHVWASTVVGVAKIDPVAGAEVDAYNLGLNEARGIDTGPDGRMWVVAGDQLVHYLPADPEGTDVATTIAGMQARGLDVGTDGRVWIADQGGKVISVNPDNTADRTEYAVGGGVQDVGAGLDSEVAFANPGDTPHEVGLISTGDAAAQEIPIDTSDPFGVAFGADGAYWIARSSTDDLLRLAPDGSTSMLSGFSDAAAVGPRKVAAGPSNTLWVTLDDQDKVARVTGVEPPQPPGGLDTEITKGPKKRVETKKAKAKVKFKFRSDNANATFECKLKKPKKKGGKNAKRAAQFKACESPKKYKLKPGKYRFQVRAVLGDARDATPATQKFKVVRKD